MGVPKFYRWISERYPCLSEVVKEYQVPEFDNLYLDMNGIIHVCSHPNDDDPHFRITEEQIFKDIFHYIEVLFRIVRPRKVFFMAVDGVAPRAKMNQQRGRRFRSAKEAEENIKKALQKGETLPDEKRFDSNCITPGTKFMVRLNEQLKYMVQSKVTSDPAWQGIRIYLSGHETPGEGEHKITEFIRHERMKPDYDPNTRHCLYGLDADLMMLGLCSHEPHFSLLREEVRFTGKKNKNARTPKPEETTFHLLHLSLMREYIDHEFGRLKTALPFEYNLESIIDDWVLMGFLVGNDFIPHLPHLHISHNALPLLYNTYMEVLPTLDGYLNENGIVNLARFEKYLEALAQFDTEKFEEHYADFKWLESKTGKRKGKPALKSKVTDSSSGELDSFCSLDGDSSSTDDKLQPAETKSIRVVKELSEKQGLYSPDSEPESTGSHDDAFNAEFKMFKRNYYQEKLHFQGTDAEIAKMAYEYVLAIQWICHYYYNGVQSWSWYYPYHYAPFLSDLRSLRKMKLRYDMGKPFLPYQQLLAVLPAASKECLPEPYWDLMCSEHSPIIDYYPKDFACDLNGKQQEWEAVVLIPFIIEKRLLAAMDPCWKKVTKDERARNVHSGCLLYTYDQNIDYHAKSSLEGTFPNIAHCKAKCEVVPLHSWSTTDTGQFVKGILPGCRLSVYYPGFPTLYHLPHKSCLRKQGVKVFQMPSRNENMIVSILPPSKKSADDEGECRAYSSGESLDDVAKNLLGTSVYVDWPHMEEAKVVAISDGSVKFEVTEHVHSTGSKGSKHKTQRKNLSRDDQQAYLQDIESVKETYLGRRGIDIGETDFVIYAQPLLGRKYICGKQGQITLEKQWATKPQAYVLQATVKDISVKDPTFQHFKGIDELFPADSTVFMLGHPYYGCQGKILNVQQGMTSVAFETPFEPDIESVIRQRHKLSSAYYAGWELASRVGVSSYMISRITGTIFIFYPTTRKWQVGLNLRFSKDSMGVAGYTKLNRGEWSYSEAVEGVLRKYMEKFPEVLRYLQDALKKNESEFDAEKMVGKGKDVIARLQEVSTWLKTLDCYGGDRISEFSDLLESKVVAAVENKVKEVKDKKSPKPIQITLKPHVLYRPLAHQGTLIPDKAAQHRLLDRVVNVRDGYTVPLGLRGTVIGIHRQPGQDALFDVVFDEEFLGGLQFGGRCSKRRGYRMPECAMINLSHGKRAKGHDHKPTAVVRPQNKFSSKPQQAWAQPVGHSFRTDRPGNQRGSSPKVMTANPDQRSWNRQRPQSSQMPGPSGQKSGSSQMDRSRPQTQPQKVNMFDALWNTLKEQNNDASEASAKTMIAKSNAASKPVPQNKPPKELPRNVGKKSFANASSDRESKIRESVSAPTQKQAKPHGKTKNACNYTTLKQAAKSLPKVSLPPQAVQTKHGSHEPASNAPSATSVTPTVTQALHASSRVRSVDEPPSMPKPSTQSAEISGKNDVDHLNQLFQSIKVSQQQPPAKPRLAFTQTRTGHDQRFNANFAPNPAGPDHAAQHHLRMRFRHPDPASNFPPHHPAFYQPWLRPPPDQPWLRLPSDQPWIRPPPDQPWLRQPYYGHPHPMQPYGNSGPPHSFLQYPGMQMAPTYTHHSAMATDTSAWPASSEHASSYGTRGKGPSRKERTDGNKRAKEGTQKLCEMLNNEQENEDANSSKWSTGEDNPDQLEEDKKIDDDIEKLSSQLDDNTLKDSVSVSSSDGDSEKDEEDYLERSTSVEDENTGIIKKLSKVDELVKLCTKCSMLAPIYTYFTTGDEQVVSTVQLWNGIRFSSHPQVSRDKAMEEAAQQAIGYLKSEQRERRPVSTSPPSSLPYFLPVHGVVQSQYYGAPATFAAPVSYAATHPQTYFVPSMPPHQIPYSVLPHAPLMSVPPEYPQAAMIPAYRYDLGPYVTRPMIRVQVSPPHQLKGAPMYHHQMAGPKPVVWGSAYHPESYHVQDHATTNRRTEFQLVDTPPFVPLQVSKQQVKLDSGGNNTPEDPSTTEVEEPAATSEKTEQRTKKSAATGKSTGQSVNRPNASAAKAKLAISFDKDKSQEA